MRRRNTESRRSESRGKDVAQSVLDELEQREAIGSFLSAWQQKPRLAQPRNARVSSALTDSEVGRDLWDPLESTCRHASLSIL